MPLSVNLPKILQKNLKIINRLNHKILLTPLSPKQELNLRWQAQNKRIAGLLSLEDNPANLTENQTDLLKKSFSYLRQNWIANPKLVSSETVIALHKINHLKTPTQPQSEQVSQTLDILNNKTQDPIIRAALAPAYLSPININSRITRLLSYLFLYQQGLNFKELLNLESFWLEDFVNYRHKLQNSTNDINSWLEYFTKTLIKQLKKIYKQINSPESDNFQDSIHLQDRHKQIISILDQPQTIISNKKIQDLFQVSQITASRDLAKLTKLNLIQSHGQGRSIYYTITP
jgi:Fic family protein